MCHFIVFLCGMDEMYLWILKKENASIFAGINWSLKEIILWGFLQKPMFVLSFLYSFLFNSTLVCQYIMFGYGFDS